MSILSPLSWIILSKLSNSGSFLTGPISKNMLVLSYKLISYCDKLKSNIIQQDTEHTEAHFFPLGCSFSLILKWIWGSCQAVGAWTLKQISKMCRDGRDRKRKKQRGRKVKWGRGGREEDAFYFLFCEHQGVTQIWHPRTEEPWTTCIFLSMLTACTEKLASLARSILGSNI